MKRLQPVLLFMAVIGALFLFAFSASAYGLGDVNGDHYIKIEDARLALRAALELEHYTPDDLSFYAADVNFNNIIEVGDARAILRYCLNLQQLERPPLPEIPALKNEDADAIVAAARQCTVIIRKTRDRNNDIYDHTGILLDADGLVATTHGAISGAKSIQALTLDGEPLQIKEILVSEGPVVLLRLEGTFTAPELSFDYAEGDGAYYSRALAKQNRFPAEISSAVRKGVICRRAVDPGDGWFENMEKISAYPESLNRSEEREDPYGLAMLDSKGRVLGLICQANSSILRAASVRSCLELLKNSQPISVEDYCEQNIRVTITPSYSETTLFPGATAFFTFDIRNADASDLRFAADTNCIEVVPITADYAKDALMVRVKRFGPEAHVRVWADNDPENSEVTLTIRIADPEKEAAPLTYAGLCVPDFGAITGVAPWGSGFSWNRDPKLANISVYYHGNAFDDAGVQEALNAFAYVAAQMGFRYTHDDKAVEEHNDYVTYVTDQSFYFEHTETNAHITLTLSFNFNGKKLTVREIAVEAYGCIFADQRSGGIDHPPG